MGGVGRVGGGGGGGEVLAFEVVEGGGVEGGGEGVVGFFRGVHFLGFGMVLCEGIVKNRGEKANVEGI